MPLKIAVVIASVLQDSDDTNMVVGARMSDPVTIEWRGDFTNEGWSKLHRDSFGNTPTAVNTVRLTARHSLGWVTAMDSVGLAGFVNVVWDGSAHAWLQDVMVATRSRSSGLGTELIAEARANAASAGCDWLHVDFAAELTPFYIKSCGFEATAAGLIRLNGARASFDVPGAETIV